LRHVRKFLEIDPISFDHAREELEEVTLNPYYITRQRGINKTGIYVGDVLFFSFHEYIQEFTDLIELVRIFSANAPISCIQL